MFSENKDCVKCSLLICNGRLTAFWLDPPLQLYNYATLSAHWTFGVYWAMAG